MLKPIKEVTDLTPMQVAIMKQTEAKLLTNFRKCKYSLAVLVEKLRTNYLRFHTI